MSHFSLENDINDLLRIDAPLSKAPLPRWQRKALESSSSVVACNANGSLNRPNASLVKTPKQAGSNDSTIVISSKTPKQTPGKSKSSPSRQKSPKTPAGGDRFIPNRTTTQFGLGHFKVVQDSNRSDDADENLSPHKKEQQKIISTALHGQDIDTARIISYSAKAPAAPEGFQTGLQVVYCHGKTPLSGKKTRHIPQTADRILDAPELIDDYYLNLLDWSSTNLVAVALSGSLYIWNASTGGIQQLLQLEAEDTYISSVSWTSQGNTVAVGTSCGKVQLWDACSAKKLRVMTGHSARVGSMSWNNHVLSSGSRSGVIIHHDVRRAEHTISTLNLHTQEVCGLCWSPDGKYLASGGNDNLLHIWCAVQGERFSEPNPLHTFTQHQAAVKALAWCPWHMGILASGGGTADRCIRLWNCNTGMPLSTTDTKSQVCSILWSNNNKELISGHGFSNNQLAIWKYPAMSKVAELTGHKSRILSMAMSPDGTTVMSAAADETLRIWKCFCIDPKKAKSIEKTACSSNIITKQRIR